MSAPALLPLLAAHRHFADMGAGEWAIAIAAALASLWSIWQSVRYAVHPGETEPDHIKRSILEDEAPAVVSVAAVPAAPAPRAPRGS